MVSTKGAGTAENRKFRYSINQNFDHNYFFNFFLSFKAFFYIKKDILKVYFRKFAKEADRFPYFNCYFRSL